MTNIAVHQWHCQDLVQARHDVEASSLSRDAEGVDGVANGEATPKVWDGTLTKNDFSAF